MDISNYNIEQCDAVSVLNAILDVYDKPTAKQVTLQQGIAQILAAIPSAATIQSGLATEANATLNKQAILDKIGTPASGQPTDLFAAIGNISVDTSDLAKQGTDPNATISAIQSKLQEVLDKSHQEIDYSGMTFTTGHEPTSAFDLAINDYKAYIVSVKDEDIASVPQMSKNDYVAIEEIEFPNATSIYNYGNGWFPNCTTLKKLVLTNCRVTQLNGYCANFLTGFTALVYLDISSGFGETYGSTFDNCINLIDIVFGAALTNNTPLLNRWNPTNALNDNVDTLVTDSQDEFGNAITNNKQQLLYNIRRHIAANLRTDVGNRTITFSSAVKAAIQADADTLAAFPSNWTIA